MTSAPDTPDLVAASDSGSSATDNLTNDTTPTFRVGLPPEAIAGNTLRVYRAGSTEIGSALLNGTDIANDLADVPVPSTLSSGGHTITARVENAAGLSLASAGLAITVDAVAPDAPTGIVVAPADQGLAPLQTDNTQPTFRISLPANAAAGDVGTLQIDGADDATAALDGTDISNGYVDIQSANALADDAFYDISAFITDVAGNEGASSAAAVVEVGTANDIPTVIYDGVQGHLKHTGGPAGAADGPALTVVWAGTFNSDGSAMVLLDVPGSVPCQLRRNSGNTITFEGGASGAVFSNTTAAVTASLGFLIVLSSCNGTSSVLKVVHAGGTITGSNSAGSATNLDLTADWFFGADNGTTDFLDADTAIWWADDGFIDFNVANNIEQFWDTTADLLRDPGADGSNPVDGAFSPLVCHKSRAASHVLNAGTGGDADMAGTFTDGTSPGIYAVDYLQQSIPSIVSGSFAHGTDGGTSSSANRTLIADYDAGAGTDRKIIAIVAHKTTSTNYFEGQLLDGLTWGSVAFRRLFNPLGNSAGALEIGYIDEADFPAVGTNAIQVNTRSSIHVSVTVFTVENAQTGLLFFGAATSSSGTPGTSASLNATGPYDNMLMLTAIVIDTSITDVSATGSGHGIEDNYDAGASATERIVVGAPAAATAGAQTLGYTFSNATYTACSFMIAPPDAYTPFSFDYAPRETAFSSATTDHQVNMPATVISGDLLIARIAMYFDELQPASTITTPSGWTLLRKFDGNDGATDSMSGAYYAKVADGTEDGTTVNFVTGANGAGAALVDRFHSGTWQGTLSGVDSASSADISSTGSIRNVPTLSPSWGDDLWLAINCIALSRDGSGDGFMGLWGTPNSDGDGQPRVSSGAGATGATVFGGYRLVKASSFGNVPAVRRANLSIIGLVGVQKAA